MARQVEDAGLSRLHIVDLDGAKSGRVVNLPVLKAICESTHLFVDFGGGIASDDDAAAVLEAGAAQMSIGSLAVHKRDLFVTWLEKYGSQRVILAADVKNGKVAVNGWLTDSGINIEDLIERYAQQGLIHVLCTDIARDGELCGPALWLYERLIQRFPAMKFIASGGVSALKDIEAARDVGVAGRVLGKAIYEQRIALTDLKELEC
jgi:phosphoribosylformimino-5-aminoimidazole carboxamide ribotide isomerase